MMSRTHIAVGAIAGAAYAAVPLPVESGWRTLAIPVAAYAALLADIDHHKSVVTWSAPPFTVLVSWVLRGMPRRWFVDGYLWSDEPVSYRWGLEHRGGTHRPVAAVVGGVLAFGALLFVVPVDVAAYLAGAVAVGWLAHLYGDARTLSGIPWPSKPDGKLRIGIPFRTGQCSPRCRRMHCRRPGCEYVRYRFGYLPAAAIAVTLAIYTIGATT